MKNLVGAGLAIANPFCNNVWERTVSMTRREVIDKLAPYMAELRQMGVSSLALFGSAARGESGDRSDLDLLIEFDRTISLFHFLKVQHRLEEIFEIPKVDLVERGALHPALRDHILAEAVHVP